MKLLLIITIIITLIQVVRVTTIFLRKDASSIKKIFELLILIVMVILEYFNLLDISKITMYLSLLLSIYILISFIYEKLCKNVSGRNISGNSISIYHGASAQWQTGNP